TFSIARSAAHAPTDRVPRSVRMGAKSAQEGTPGSTSTAIDPDTAPINGTYDALAAVFLLVIRIRRLASNTIAATVPRTIPMIQRASNIALSSGVVLSLTQKELEPVHRPVFVRARQRRSRNHERLATREWGKRVSTWKPLRLSLVLDSFAAREGRSLRWWRGVVFASGLLQPYPNAIR